MQQTTKYKLNLVEKTDTFSPDALNQNTQKVEEVLAGEETARTAADSALEQRVTVLEAHKILVGTYVGDGNRNRVISLGVTPKLVLIRKYGDNSYCTTLMPGNGTFSQGGTVQFSYIVNGGFSLTNYDLNNNSATYHYFAIV